MRARKTGKINRNESEWGHAMGQGESGSLSAPGEVGVSSSSASVSASSSSPRPDGIWPSNEDPMVVPIDGRESEVEVEKWRSRAVLAGSGGMELPLQLMKFGWKWTIHRQ